DAALLERLAQHLKDAPVELRHLVEEQHTVMRETDLAGPRILPATDECDVGNRVMRRAKWSLRGQPMAASDQPGDRVDGRDLQRLIEDERGKNAADAPRHHRLA